MSWVGNPKTWTNVLVDDLDLNAEVRDRFNVLKTSINDDGTLKPTGLTAISLATDFSNLSRMAAASITGGGVNSPDTLGIQLATGGSGGGSAGVVWTIGGPNGSLFLGSPRMSARLSITLKGSDGQFFVGIGQVTVAAAGITYTDPHVGFKIVWATSGAASLYATQATGGVETASAALTTVVVDDDLDLIVQMIGTASVNYYWRKNGGALSSPTTLTTNIPTASSGIKGVHSALSNVNVATADQIAMHALQYQR